MVGVLQHAARVSMWCVFGSPELLLVCLRAYVSVSKCGEAMRRVRTWLVCPAYRRLCSCTHHSVSSRRADKITHGQIDITKCYSATLRAFCQNFYLLARMACRRECAVTNTQYTVNTRTTCWHKWPVGRSLELIDETFRPILREVSRCIRSRGEGG